MVTFEMNIDISRVCRSCLSENSDTYYQINESAKCHNGSRFDWRDLELTIAEVIMACTVVQIRPGDGLPQAVCMECLDQVQQAFEFKKICEATDEKLHKYAADVKIEDDQCEDSICEPETIHVSEISVKERNDIYNELNGEIENVSNVPDCSDECDNDSNAYYDPIEKPEVKESQLKDVDEKTLMEQTQIINGRYQCVLCTKSLGARKSYRLHLRLHIGKNLSRCMVCDRGFAKKSHLDRHLLTHKKIAKCNYCTRIFATEDEQNEHMQMCSKLKTHRSKPTVDELSTEQSKRKTDLVAAKKAWENVCDSVDGDKTGNSSDYDQDRDKSSLEKPIRIQSNDTERPIRIPLDEEELKWVKKAKQIEGDRWQCPLCPKTVVRKVIRIHIRKHVGRHLIQCRVCDHSFVTNSKLKQHMSLHPKHGNFFPCDKCDEIFKTLNDQKYHIEITHTIGSEQTEMETSSLQPKSESNHNDGNIVDEEEQINRNSKLINGRYQCRLCEKYLSSAETIKLHIRLHLGLNLKKCPFKYCLRKFSKKSHLDRHLKTHEKVKHECKLCDVEYQTYQALHAHMYKIHGDESKCSQMQQSLKCDQCPKKFYQEEHLTAHKQGHLLPKKVFECDVCQKQFSRLDNLRSHMQRHIPREQREDVLKKYLCSYCGVSFNNSSNLTVHIRRHTGYLPFRCENCDRRFPRSCDLICHRRTHTGEKPFVCNCGKAFSRSNQLVRHMRIHTGEKPYKCLHVHCGKSFTQLNDLKLHVRRHTGEKPFVCNCGKRFITSSLLKQHRKSQGHAGQVIGETFKNSNPTNTQADQKLNVEQESN